MTHWRREKGDDNIIWLHFDKAGTGTNVLSKEVLLELDSVIAEISTEHPAGLIILSDKKNGFIAGADVKEFTTLTETAQAAEMIKRGQAIFNRLEELPFPTVCLIHGFCLGGGLELALACQYRVARDDEKTKLGLPEIKLGIHPGYGGTVRLPSLIGGPAAMDLMLTGRAVNARTAKKLGLVDYAVPERHLKTRARALIREKPRTRGFSWKKMTNIGVLRPLVARVIKKGVEKRVEASHYPAPYALIDLWKNHRGSRHDLFNQEAASVAALMTGSTAPNLVRVFLLQERLKSLGRKTDFSPKHVHVIGAGVMGGDIAAWCALKGLRVTLQDREPRCIAPAIKRAFSLYNKRLKRPIPIQAAMDRLLPDPSGTGVARADVVIEAIFENIQAKQDLYKTIEPRLRDGALFVTNTSSIPLEELTQSLHRPGRLVGLHFFNPVARMPLVEVVTAGNTSRDEAARAAAFARKIDRLPLPVTSSPGFLVNRILMPYLLEAVTIESEGVPASMIDRAAVTFGMPMGPIALADKVGLDICLSVAEIMSKRMPVTIPERLRELVRAGTIGQKSGRGFYAYKGGKPVIPSAMESTVPPDDLTDRLILRILNESAACIRTGVVEDVDLLDAGVIFGTGFSPFRGGPLHYSRARGIPSLVKQLKELEERHGERFRPDPGWEDYKL